MFLFLQGAYITAVIEPPARVQRKALLEFRSHTFCILGIFVVIVCVLIYNIHYYPHAAFAESKTICLRYIACVVTAFSLRHCSMPLDTPN